MPAPSTAERWWTLAESRRLHLADIMSRVGMTQENRVALLAAIGRRDARPVCELLQRTWENAPDAPVIHTWPGWDALCDLCSENYLVKENVA